MALNKCQKDLIGIYQFLIDMRSNQEIEVNIFHNNELFTFSFPSGSTVGDLRNQIFNELQILPEHQDLEFNHSSIFGDQRKLTDLSENMPILITVEITEERLFHFNNLKQRKIQVYQTTKNLRSPKLVYPGLIFKAECNNYGCDAYKKEVNINHGFGKFDLGRLLQQGLCPLCMTKTGRIYNFGYYQTNILIEGYTEENGQYKMLDCADDNRFHTFNQSNGIQSWNFCEITTTALENRNLRHSAFKQQQQKQLRNQHENDKNQIQLLLEIKKQHTQCKTKIKQLMKQIQRKNKIIEQLNSKLNGIK